jgi:hypothetical protein
MQPEMNININIQHHPKQSLVIREYIANRMLVAAELYTATGQIMYQGNLHLATGRPDFTRDFRFDTETLPVTAQVLSRFLVKVHRGHDIFSRGRVLYSDANLCPSQIKVKQGTTLTLYGKQGVTEVPGNDRNQFDGLLKSLLVESSSTMLALLSASYHHHSIPEYFLAHHSGQRNHLITYWDMTYKPLILLAL